MTPGGTPTRPYKAVHPKQKKNLVKGLFDAPRNETFLVPLFPPPPAQKEKEKKKQRKNRVLCTSYRTSTVLLLVSCFHGGTAVKENISLFGSQDVRRMVWYSRSISSRVGTGWALVLYGFML